MAAAAGRAARGALHILAGAQPGDEGERAQARGWLARAQHLLENAAGGCAEQGLLLALTARLRIQEKDINGAHDAAARAAELARRFDDSDLQVFSRLCFAQVVATRGDAAAATALFDEIMVAVTVGDVSPIGIGIVLRRDRGLPCPS